MSSALSDLIAAEGGALSDVGPSSAPLALLAARVLLTDGLADERILPALTKSLRDNILDVRLVEDTLDDMGGGYKASPPNVRAAACGAIFEFLNFVPDPRQRARALRAVASIGIPPLLVDGGEGGLVDAAFPSLLDVEAVRREALRVCVESGVEAKRVGAFLCDAMGGVGEKCASAFC